LLQKSRNDEGASLHAVACGCVAIATKVRGRGEVEEWGADRLDGAVGRGGRAVGRAARPFDQRRRADSFCSLSAAAVTRRRQQRRPSITAPTTKAHASQLGAPDVTRLAVGEQTLFQSPLTPSASRTPPARSTRTRPRPRRFRRSPTPPRRSIDATIGRSFSSHLIAGLTAVPAWLISRSRGRLSSGFFDAAYRLERIGHTPPAVNTRWAHMRRSGGPNRRRMAEYRCSVGKLTTPFGDNRRRGDTARQMPTSAICVTGAVDSGAARIGNRHVVCAQIGLMTIGLYSHHGIRIHARRGGIQHCTRPHTNERHYSLT
jgi:hypothetical protein